MVFGHHHHEEPLPALAPFNPPLGPQPPHVKCYSPNETVLVLKEKIFSLTGDDFTIQTTEGIDIMTCKGKFFSIHSKKLFNDMQGQELFTLENKLMSFRGSFFAVSPEGYNFEIKGKFKMLGSRSVVEFKNASDGQAIELEVVGDWIDRKAEIKIGDRVVARIARKFMNARQLLGDDQTYHVAVAPNVDLSLIAAICISIDDREKEKSGR